MSYQDTGPSGGGFMPGFGGNILGAILGSLGGIFQNERNIAFQRDANAQNIEFQRETNEQNEALMREAWAREDTAVSRRANDLRAAGLNPVLAAGSAASSGSPIQLKAPEMEAPQQGSEPLMQGLAAAGAVADIEARKAAISQTKAQTKLVERQQQSVDLDNKLKAGTLDPKIQEAQASAEVATKTMADQIARAGYSNAELQEKITYLQRENELFKRTIHDRANKYLFDARIRQLESALLESTWDTQVKQVEAELATEQVRAILYRAQAAQTGATASQTEMDARFYKKIGVSPALGDRIFQALNVIIQGIKAF